MDRPLGTVTRRLVARPVLVTVWWLLDCPVSRQNTMALEKRVHVNRPSGPSHWSHHSVPQRRPSLFQGLKAHDVLTQKAQPRKAADGERALFSLSTVSAWGDPGWSRQLQLPPGERPLSLS